MPLPQEFIEKSGLSEDTVTELNTVIDPLELDETQQTAFVNALSSANADFAQKYSGEANTNAEKILSGAATKVTTITGVERDEGEKLADFFVRAGQKHISSREEKLKVKEKELEEKIKNGDISEAAKKELTETQQKLEELQKKEAEFEEASELAQKYPELETKYNTLKIKNGFNSVKPSFPKEVNEYEAKAIWGEWEKSILEKYDIEFDEDGTAIGIDKSNPQKQKKLSDLLAKDEKIQSLLEGRNQDGLRSKPGGAKKIEGVPFDVPDDSAGTSKAISEYIINELKTPRISSEYPKKFAEFYKLITEKRQKTA